MLRLPRVVNDIRLALRRLGATPLFAVFAILSLAIGVAITTAVYSIVDSSFCAASASESRVGSPSS